MAKRFHLQRKMIGAKTLQKREVCSAPLSMMVLVAFLADTPVHAQQSSVASSARQGGGAGVRGQDNARFDNSGAYDLYAARRERDRAWQVAKGERGVTRYNSGSGISSSGGGRGQNENSRENGGASNRHTGGTSSGTQRTSVPHSSSGSATTVLEKRDEVQPLE